MSKNLNDIAVLNIRSVDCRCIINEINKSEAMVFLKNAFLENLNKKSETLYNTIFLHRV